MGKYIFTVLLTVMSAIAGIAAIVYKSNPRIAVLLLLLWGVLGLLAIVAGYIESIPKPHLVPVGYGQIGEQATGGTFDGLLFENDGEPAYDIRPPNPARFGDLGDPMLVFSDPGIARLTKEQGIRCFPATVKTALGERVNNLPTQLAFSGADSVVVSFQYADGKHPRSLRYTTVCKIELHRASPMGLKVSLIDYKLDWPRFFWGRE